MTMYDKYIEAVQDGTEVACVHVQRAVYRHLTDLEKSADDDYLYRFDRKKADNAIALALKIRHTGGDFMGLHFRLQPFQAFILAMIFGWVKKENGKRRFIRSYISIARKNGKTELMALIMVLMFLFDGEKRANIVSAATQRDQAMLSFEAAKIMLEYVAKESPGYFGKCLEFVKSSVADNRYKSSMTVVSTDRGKYDGKNIHLSIVDEYHAHLNSKLLDVLASSTGSRSQPMTSIITTAGFDTMSACAKLEAVYKTVLAGDKDEERTFILIFTLDEEDEQAIAAMDVSQIDMSMFKKANPNMGVSLYEDIFMADLQTALNQGGPKWIEFLTKKLNVWTNQFSVWLPSQLVRSRGADYSLADLAGRRCFAGLDLASRRDIASLCLYFPYPDDEPDRVLSYHFVPTDNAKERAANDRVKYLDWIRDGHMIGTDGNVTDYRYIKQKLIEINEVVDIEELAYDRFNSSQLIIELQEEGFDCVGFGQGFISMNAPTKDIDGLYRDGGILHNNDPVLMWSFGNVTMKIDPADNWKVDKGKSSEKVDPVVAQIMARGQYMDWRHRNQSLDIGLMAII